MAQGGWVGEKKIPHFWSMGEGVQSPNARKAGAFVVMRKCRARASGIA